MKTHTVLGEPQAPAARRAVRGRVVMLVDNAIEGDSRVQKQARSMADAGWEVSLIGVTSPGGRRLRWQIGDAEAQLVRLPRPLAVSAASMRPSLRRPLAYAGATIADLRRQQAAARVVDLCHRRATLAPGAVGQRVRLASAYAMNALARRWIGLRAAEHGRLERARQNPEALLNRWQLQFWRTVRRTRSWRNLDPGLWDFEIGLARHVDRLDPDIIHANDHRMLGVGARAKMRAASRGRDVKLVWDAHEYVPGLAPLAGAPKWLAAQIAYEREHAHLADAVVTVSPGLADLLRSTHRLPETPAVVLNCPELSASTGPAPDLRADCGIGPDDELIVYCGGISEARNNLLMVEALPDLAGVHAAFVSVPPSGRRTAADQLLTRARELGVVDRVHVLPYVPHDQVVAYLAGADAAVSPLLHLPNHEIALSNKFFEYAHARLPLVTSDVRTMADMVRANRMGEVYRAGDRADYVRAVRSVLAAPEEFRAAYDRPGLLDDWNWDRQAAVLDKVYTQLVAGTVPQQRHEENR